MSKRVVITDQRLAAFDPPRDRFPDWQPILDRNEKEHFREAVEAVGGTVVLGEFESEAEVVEGCRDADVVVTFKAPITAAAFEAMEHPRLVLRSGTGYDNVDVDAATEHGVPVSNLPYASEEVASHAMALLLGAAHEVAYSDRSMRTSEGWGDRLPLHPIYGATMGIVGLGRIGRALVPKARGFDMDVIAYDPYLSADVFDLAGVERVGFDELLERSDCVSVHTPLSAETRHLFSTEAFRRMKPSAILVNTARGPLVDVPALVEAVETGEIWAAGLDCFEQEPPTDSPALACDHIVCSPHHAGFSAPAIERSLAAASEEIVRALEGRQLQHVVNPEVFQYGESFDTPEAHAWQTPE